MEKLHTVADVWRGGAPGTQGKSLSAIMAGLAFVFCLAGWYTWQQYEDYKSHQWRLLLESARGAAGEVGSFIEEQRRRVDLFASDEHGLLNRFASRPDDAAVFAELGGKLRIHFPKSYAFTLADQTGTLLYDDFGEFVGEQCKNDIRAFANHGSLDHVIVHPGPQVYHVDIMSYWRQQTTGEQGVFFVSFKLDVIRRLLASHQLSSQKLMVVNRSNSNLIEVSASGTRDELQREPFLSKTEADNIAASLPIEGTGWNLVAIANEDQYHQVFQQLLRKNAMVLGIATIVLLSAWLLWVETGRRRAAVRSWEQSEEQLQLLLDSTAEGIYGVDLQGVCSFCNPAAVRMLGFTAQRELLGRKMHGLVHHSRADGEPYPIREWPVIQTLERKLAHHMDDEVLWRADGTPFPVEYWSYPILKHGRLVGAVVTFVDATERKLAEKALYEEKERALVTLHSIGDAVITTDPDGIVDYLNPVAEEITGWSSKEAAGCPLDEVFRIVNEHNHKPVQSPVIRCLAEGRTIGLANHTVLIHRDGKRFSIEDTAAPILAGDGTVLGVVLVFKDVSEARRMAREIAHQASHDSLTGLVNRRAFEERLRRVLETTRGTQNTHALCYLDLDQFKVINDTCGHVAGDELLRQIAGILQSKIRTRDTLARLGGDEFGVLMEHCPLAQSKRVAELLRKSIEGFRFLWEDKAFEIGVSIGLVELTEISESVSSVLRAADIACYAAKDLGRNRIHFYRQDDADLTKRHGEMEWIARILRAIEEERFQLYYQPIVPLQPVFPPGQHYELLVRMRDENGRIVLPGSFMPAAERYGVVEKIDRWVIENALRWLAGNPILLERLYLCSINLSGQSLGSDSSFAFITQLFDETGVSPNKICFEITETAAITNLVEASRFIKMLRQRGCRFALDDFGSGLCSFAYLTNLPVDFLKIDGLFIKSILDDPIHLAMVRSINEIGQVMGKQTIAEFVENEEIAEKLKSVGIDCAQGFGIGRPQPIEALS